MKPMSSSAAQRVAMVWKAMLPRPTAAISRISTRMSRPAPRPPPQQRGGDEEGQVGDGVEGSDHRLGSVRSQYMSMDSDHLGPGLPRG